MPQIPIEKAIPGMVVTEPVTNDKGMVILPTGTKLNEALIIRLKKWNVQTLVCQGDVQGSDASSSAMVKNVVMDASLEKHLAEKFKPVLDDPIMQEVYNAVKVYYQDSMQETK